MAKRRKKSELPVLRLSTLSNKRLHGLPKGAAGYYLEGAAICLESCKHGPESVLSVVGAYKGSFMLVRPALDAEEIEFYQESSDPTQYGAIGITILLVTYLTGLRVRRIAAIGTGFDYHLVPPEQFLFQESMPLEVSGVRQGSSATRVNAALAERRRRLEERKIARGIISVVDFPPLVAHVVRYEQA